MYFSHIYIYIYIYIIHYTYIYIKLSPVPPTFKTGSTTLVGGVWLDSEIQNVARNKHDTCPHSVTHTQGHTHTVSHTHTQCHTHTHTVSHTHTQCHTHTCLGFEPRTYVPTSQTEDVVNNVNWCGNLSKMLYLHSK